MHYRMNFSAGCSSGSQVDVFHVAQSGLLLEGVALHIVVASVYYTMLF